jgi:plastocyanin domain-containing protein
MVALGSPLSLTAIAGKFQNNGTQNASGKIPGDVPTSQNIVIEITPQGYSPNYIRVKKGSPVTIKVVNRETYSCASAFRIPSLGFSANLQPGQEKTITFTPSEVGRIPFSCSMGMYRGVIEVL